MNESSQSDSSILKAYRNRFNLFKKRSNKRGRFRKSSFNLIFSKYNHDMYQLWWFSAQYFYVFKTIVE